MQSLSCHFKPSNEPCVKQWEWASENPVRKISREKEPRERTRFLSSEERSRFLEACRISDNSYLFTFVVLLLSTGGRYNEIRCLKWPDVDLHTSPFGITSQMLSERLLKEAKIATTPMVGWGETTGKYVRFIFSNEPQERLIGLGKKVKKVLRM